MAAIRTLLLDVGGTLAMPNFARMAAEYRADGVEVSVEALSRGELATRRAFESATYARPHTDVWLSFMLEVARLAGVSAPPLAAFERLRAYHDTHNLWEELIDGTEAALRELARSYRLGVVSNANGTVRAKLGRLGLGHFFETVVDSGEEGIEKPDPRLFAIALERMGELPERAAYVGDMFRVDVLGARAAGLFPILIDFDGGHADKACARVASLAEVGRVLAALG